MEDEDLNDRELKAAVIKKLNDIQENVDHSMSSDIKLMNKRNTLSKRMKL